MAKLSAHRWQSYFLLLINTVLWGAAFVIVKPAFDITTPYRFLFYRYLIASIAILPVVIWLWPHLQKLAPARRTQKLLQILAAEVLGSGLALGALYSGLKLTSALEANLIATTLPIFVTLGGIWLLREKVKIQEQVGLAIAFAGTIFLTIIPFFGLNGQFTQFSIWGNLLIILHNLANMLYFPLAKKYYRGLPKLLVSGLSFYVALVFFFLLSLWELPAFSLNQLWSISVVELTNFNVWWPAFYMAIFGSIIGLTVYLKGQEKIEASEASLFWYLQPLVYVPLGMIMLGEKINLYQVAALIIIFGGVFLAEKRK